MDTYATQNATETIKLEAFPGRLQVNDVSHDHVIYFHCHVLGASIYYDRAAVNGINMTGEHTVTT